ncbi:hypothetical protein P170DRAFT_420649 [Aspergillus steynii IBT 23096]|uniref:Ankyrin n=1 Tax=Aspergillus steynii IBT 23096 TaxID=1392250 RepID=A0A2I2GLU2_9EURO|nr:uncharacterized protein P170DRAFT_420649 [Aspergillus steynii IBT 23096]PLB53844.1 hypothetical protein P170DRAFT_420649 [Aspergillus steynii IBT 23096]
MNHNEGGNAESRIKDSQASPVYYAALLGLTHTVQFLTAGNKFSAEEKVILGRTALVAASEKGHYQIVEDLLASAIWRCYLKVVKLLLNYLKMYHVKAILSYLKVVKLLLNYLKMYHVKAILSHLEVLDTSYYCLIKWPS